MATATPNGVARVVDAAGTLIDELFGGGGAAEPALLKEDGFYLLKEDGFRLLLE